MTVRWCLTRLPNLQARCARLLMCTYVRCTLTRSRELANNMTFSSDAKWAWGGKALSVSSPNQCRHTRWLFVLSNWQSRTPASSNRTPTLAQWLSVHSCVTRYTTPLAVETSDADVTFHDEQLNVSVVCFLLLWQCTRRRTTLYPLKWQPARNHAEGPEILYYCNM